MDSEKEYYLLQINRQRRENSMIPSCSQCIKSEEKKNFEDVARWNMWYIRSEKYCGWRREGEERLIYIELLYCFSFKSSFLFNRFFGFEFSSVIKRFHCFYERSLGSTSTITMKDIKVVVRTAKVQFMFNLVRSSYQNRFEQKHVDNKRKILLFLPLEIRKYCEEKEKGVKENWKISYAPGTMLKRSEWDTNLCWDAEVSDRFSPHARAFENL